MICKHLRPLRCLVSPLAVLLLLGTAVASAEERDSSRLQRPQLFLLELQTVAVYVVPLVIAQKQTRIGAENRVEDVLLQFAKTRKKTDPPTDLERSWYSLYDYDALGRQVES